MSTTSANAPSWQLWIDTGGTFTDCIAKNPGGEIHRLKILSSGVLRGTVTAQPNSRTLSVNTEWPVDEDIFTGFQLHVVGTKLSAKVTRVDLVRKIIELSRVVGKIKPGSLVELTSNEEVPVLAARLLTRTPPGKPFPPLEIKLGSTRGTNAILERKGARTAFLVTAGFKDLLKIGNQQRPDLFALNVIKHEPLYKDVLEVEERISSDGSVLIPLSPAHVHSLIKRLRTLKIESVAVALLNAYANPEHERQISRLLRMAGFTFVSVSHELSPQIRLLTRAETTVANAYLEPIIRSYISGIRQGLTGARMFMMTSSGSLVRAEVFHPKDSLLSGPAGGVVGAAHQAAKSGIKRVLAFDMGGTSTDVSMYDRRFDYRFESRVGHLSILSPSLAIETIAAGGGSICAFDGHRLLVGPHSAGARPGPACYGAGGPLTITDVNLLMGRIDPWRFAIPLKPEAARRAFQKLLKQIQKATRRKPREQEVLSSLLQIANEKMADAIRRISVRQGHDPREFTLFCFGGAGGQHAVALAETLGMREILIPYDAGLLSAYGIGQAAVERFEEKLVLKRWSEVNQTLDDVLNQLFLKARERLVSEGCMPDDVRRKHNLLYLRFAGQDSPIEVQYEPGQHVVDLFRKRYESIYGHWTDREIELESMRVVAIAGGQREIAQSVKPTAYRPEAEKTITTTTRGRARPTGVFRWEKLKPGACITGPALIVSGNATTFVETGWSWNLDASGNALMFQDKQSAVARSGKSAREGELELFANRFTAIAQEMGALLERTSFSVNIKERLDFSCAMLDANGFLVVNAPHIPVHLGSMGVCVREVRKTLPMEEGDVVITNHPAFGGSHLPDVTLIKPVFHKRKLIGYVANRAHHAEIGGSKPGSMPADATRLEQEGVVIAPTYLVEKGKVRWNDIEKVLITAPFPTRALQENLADLNGALASVNLGEQRLQLLCSMYGPKAVVHNMKVLRRYAADLLRRRISSLRRTTLTAAERLDDGSPLCVHITPSTRRLNLDFSGSSKEHHGNLNATRAIVQSVVLYVLRLLVDAPLPMNEGLMDHVKIVLPGGLLNPDFQRGTLPAVVGGNTEVSQRLTDTLLKAFGLAACSQGTMNNFLFGNDRFGYYETICGGTGAGPGFQGVDAVHQHMTNTRITDPEVVEHRYPVRLWRFEIRTGSGGKGLTSGGNGAIREFEFLEPLEVNLLCQHQKVEPYGMKGGLHGKKGNHLLVEANGTQHSLHGVCGFKVKKGDRIVLRTPGGGGWGKAKRNGQSSRVK